MVLDEENSSLFEQGMAAPGLKLDSPVLQTDRLLLRPPLGEDARDMARLANDYGVASMLSNMPHPYFAEDAREFLGKVKEAPQGNCVYAITRLDSGEFMGTRGIHEDRDRDELPFIGYWLGRPYWGHGFATEAARAMLDLFFKVTDRDSVMISCRRDNASSRRVIEKCNGRFWKQGSLYNRALGAIHELDHFRVTRMDWFSVAGDR